MKRKSNLTHSLSGFAISSGTARSATATLLEIKDETLDVLFTGVLRITIHHPAHRRFIV